MNFKFELNKKLIPAYNKQKFEKVKALIILGAQDNELLYHVIYDNNIDILQTLIKYHDGGDLSEFVRIAVDNKRVECLKILLQKVNLNDYRQTVMLDKINELIKHT